MPTDESLSSKCENACAAPPGDTLVSFKKICDAPECGSVERLDYIGTMSVSVANHGVCVETICVAC